jgi:Flp pilus assembly protein protease CpaA
MYIFALLKEVFETQHVILFQFGLMAAYSDMYEEKITNRMIIAFLPVLLPLSIFEAPSAKEIGSRVFLSFMIFLAGNVLFVIHACGAGDIKFMMAVALSMPVEYTSGFILVSLCTFLSAGIIIIGLRAVNALREESGHDGREKSIPVITETDRRTASGSCHGTRLPMGPFFLLGIMENSICCQWFGSMGQLINIT